MKNRIVAFIIFALPILFISCVSSKKLKSAEEESQRLQTELTTSDNNLRTANEKVDDLSKENSSLKKQVKTLKNRNSSLTADATKYRKLKKEEKTREANLNAALAAQGTSMKEIENRLVTGLSQLVDAGMEVSYEEGLLHISLPEKMLFQAGNATLNKSANNSLSSLASILNEYPKVRIYVIGHTDSHQIHTSRFYDNWSLSTERANSIVRILSSKYSVDPARLLSAGRSEYMPIASNDNKDGRSLNRRIEIVLNPNLIKLYEMMNVY